MPTKEAYNAYMNEYMKKRYFEKIEDTKLYKKSIYIKKKYNIDDDTWKKYGQYLNNVIKITEMLRELPEDMADDLIVNHKEIRFEVK